MVTEIHGRLKDAPWFNKLQEIEIILGGAGGIGSWTAFLMARAGFPVMVYDHDTVEVHNIGGQIYGRSDVRGAKVTRLRTFLINYADTEIVTFQERFTENSPVSGHCIAAFDNMEARKLMYTKWKQFYGNEYSSLFIDGRLSAEQMWIYCIRGGDIISQTEYENDKLFEDSEIPDDPCTYKQTSHAAAMIASHIVGFFTNHITNIVEQDNTREVPFEWSYFIPMNMIEQVVNPSPNF